MPCLYDPESVGHGSLSAWVPAVDEFLLGGAVDGNGGGDGRSVNSSNI